MTSRERIRAIFSGKSPDRVGWFEQAVFSSVASAILGREAHTGGTHLHWAETKAWARGDAAHEEFLERVYRDNADLSRVLGFDMVAMPWLFGAKPSRVISEYEYLFGDPDAEWSLYRYDPASETFGRADSSRKGKTVNDLRRDVAANEKHVSEFSGEPENAKCLERLLADFGGACEVLAPGGMSIPLEEPWLMAIALDPGLVGALLDAQVEWNLKLMRWEAARGFRIVWGGGDFADKNGPVYGPRVFRELMLPRWKRIAEECHRLGMWYVLRSDGDLRSVTDMIFSEAGIDGYGEIDWEAGMDLAALKPRYPRAAFWGNVPPPLLLHGSKDAVLAAARHCIDAVPDRRLILGSSNSVLPGTPVENVFALKEAAEKWGSA